jgi:hypothetical protein
MADYFSICWSFFEGCEEVFAGAHAVSIQKREPKKQKGSLGLPFQVYH